MGAGKCFASRFSFARWTREADRFRLNPTPVAEKRRFADYDGWRKPGHIRGQPIRHIDDVCGKPLAASASSVSGTRTPTTLQARPASFLETQSLSVNGSRLSDRGCRSSSRRWRTASRGTSFAPTAAGSGSVRPTASEEGVQGFVRRQRWDQPGVRTGIRRAGCDGRFRRALPGKAD